MNTREIIPRAYENGQMVAGATVPFGIIQSQKFVPSTRVLEESRLCGFVGTTGECTTCSKTQEYGENNCPEYSVKGGYNLI